MSLANVVFFVAMAILASAVLCKPLDESDAIDNRATGNRATGQPHPLWKRFVNPTLTFGGFSDRGVTKMRTKRSSEDCERLQLCKLHARSSRNFLAAFELYFVNKENAKLWDHHARSRAECERKFGDCYRK